MRKRKGRQSENTDTLNHSQEGEDDFRNGRSEELEEGEKSGFFACYLLTSLSPRHKGQTYIGFTVNPRRRIRQHNGEICSGANSTKKKRPWEMVLCIYGFPTNVAALQFEWAWQHPVNSLAVRKAAVEFKSLGGLANKIKLAYTMLTLPTWNTLNLNVNFFSSKYTKHYAGCPTLPSHMRVHVRSMDELPCYTQRYKEQEEDDMFGEEEPVFVSANRHNYEEDEEPPTSVSDTANMEQPSWINNLSDNDEEAVFVFPDSQNIEEYEEPTTSVSDNEKLQQPSWTNNLSDDDEEAVFVFPDYQNNQEEETYVSNTQDHDLDDVWVLSNTPVKSVIEDGNGKVNGGIGSGSGSGSGNEIPVFGGGVEVIDIFSPSPEYNLRRKRRSVFADCPPEVIDLTQSPICV